MLAFATSAMALLTPQRANHQALTRRQVLCSAVAALGPGAACADTGKDCMLDCESTCNRLAPGSTRYCFTSCSEYCAATDRRDGLSGSVSNEAAEIGWASAVDPSRFIPGVAPKAVQYGSDRPPALPDVFGVNAKLRKAITGGATPNGGPASVEAQGGVQ